MKMFLSKSKTVILVLLIAVVFLGSYSYMIAKQISHTMSSHNSAVEKLNASQQAAQAEIDSLRAAQESADQALESLEAKCDELKEALRQSVAERDIMAEQVDLLENELERVNKYLDAPEDRIRIYIDQGHNPDPYHNSGSVGNGLREEDVTFLVGRLLADILREDNRFVVQLSRPSVNIVLGTDNASSIMARIVGAREFDADYLISLHTNAFTEGGANGLEVYVAKEGSESYAFGEYLLDSLLEATGLRNRGMKLNSDLDILEFSTMPAVLVEMGFISNVDDARLLAEQPELFAEALYKGILNYFGMSPKR